MSGDMFKGRLRKLIAAAGILAGLCAPVQANTTAAKAALMAPVAAATASVQIAQNDISIFSGPDVPIGMSGASASPAGESGSSPAPGSPVPAGAQKIRIALLLPLRSEPLGQAAEMVRAGFMAAFEREQTLPMTVNTVQTGDAPADIVAAYLAALRDNDIVVGPLSRSGVTAIAQSGAVSKPTIALTQAESAGDAEMPLPPYMVSIGLSVEQEARQVAAAFSQTTGENKAFVIATPTAWQRRAARAFASQWQRGRRGAKVEMIEIGLNSGYLNANTLVGIRKRMQAENPGLLFLALDAGQARQLREAVGGEVIMAGTSQLNPLTMQEWITAERVPDMNGLRLVDMPWQLLVDHPAVMAYPRPVLAPDQRRSVDFERLYALGIDAYRVAREIAQNRSWFEIDGVTGKLTVEFGRGPAHFERVMTPAAYRDGTVAPLDTAR